MFIKEQSGFTIIEMIIYVAIIGVVLSGFITFSVNIADSRNKVYVMQEVQANNRHALNLISQKIQSATGVNIGSSTFGSDPGYLSLSMTDVSKNPTVIALDQDDGILQITEGLGSTINVTTDKVKVTNLVFTNLTSGSEKENIRVEITTQYNNLGGDIEFGYSQNLQTAVSVRQ